MVRSYNKDMTDFLQKLISHWTTTRKLPLVTADVVSLYTNIPHKDGWMDELGFYVPSRVFQSFRDDERVNMKGSVQ